MHDRDRPPTSIYCNRPCALAHPTARQKKAFVHHPPAHTGLTPPPPLAPWEWLLGCDSVRERGRGGGGLDARSSYCSAARVSFAGDVTARDGEHRAAPRRERRKGAAARGKPARGFARVLPRRAQSVCPARPPAPRGAAATLPLRCAPAECIDFVLVWAGRRCANASCLSTAPRTRQVCVRRRRLERHG